MIPVLRRAAYSMHRYTPGQTIFSVMQAHTAAGRHDEAAKLLRIAKCNPTTATEAQIWEGMQVLNSDPHRAYRLFNSAVIAMPDNAELYLLQARAAALTGEAELAHQLTENALYVDPLSPTTRIAAWRSRARSFSQDALQQQLLKALPDITDGSELAAVLPMLPAEPLGIVTYDPLTSELHGWAVDPSQPSAVVQLECLAMNQRMVLSADDPSPLLQAAGLPGDHGIRLKIPAGNYRLEVRVVGGNMLSGAPLAPLPPLVNPPPPKGDPRKQPVDILIPVYRGEAETLACIHSVLAARKLNGVKHDIVVLEDASPEPALVTALIALAQAGLITLVRHPANLGFIRGMNRGMVMHPERDVIWLNADTLVHGNWVDRLRQAAYSAPEIASVTPFSNNGELMSFPEPSKSHPMPDAEQLKQLDTLAAGTKAAPVPLDVGNGFCMYLRRKAMGAIGFLDEIHMARGYGEETDWCLRATAAGFRHIGAPNVFVAHKGEVSFGAEKRARVKQNLRIIEQRYPWAEQAYVRFKLRDSTRPARNRLQMARLKNWIAHHANSSSTLRLRMGRYDTSNTKLTVDGGSEQTQLLLTSEYQLGQGWATLSVCGSMLPMQLRYAIPQEMSQLVRDLSMMPLLMTSDSDPAPEFDTLISALGLSTEQVARKQDTPSIAHAAEAAASATVLAVLPQPSAERYAGELTGLHADMVHGWVKDLYTPDRPVILEILADGQVENTCMANQNHVDGHDCGFSYRIPARVLANARHISARVANHDFILPGALRLGAHQNSKGSVPSSQAWYSGGLVISGWLWDAEQPGVQLRVQVREGTKVVASTMADQPHPALVWMQSAEHGYRVELPIALADGQVHELHVESESGAPVIGSPIHICSTTQGLDVLLARWWPANAPRQRMDALMALAQAQERINPAPVGFEHYPQWFASREMHTSCPQDPAHVQKASIIVINRDDEAAYVNSMTCIAAQSTAVWRASQAREDLRAAIQADIADGAQIVIGLTAGDRLASTYHADIVSAFEPAHTVWVYTDCDQDGANGERQHPWLKPAWDPDLFLGMDLVTPGSAWRASFLSEVLAQFPDAPLPDWQSVSVLAAHFLLVFNEDKRNVERVTAVLYHRSQHASAQPEDSPRSPDCVRLLSQLVAALDARATVLPIKNFAGLSRVRWSMPTPCPRVSLIVPTRDQVVLLKACMTGLLAKTDYPDLEIIVVDNQSSDPATLTYLNQLERQGVRVLRHPHPFNYSTINNAAVDLASGEIVGLINNDIEVLNADWLKEMVSQLSRPGVGAVGAKLLWPNGMIQHGGVVLGVGGLAAHTGNYWRHDDSGYLGYAQVTRRQSAVTAACLLVRRRDYLALGGFNPIDFPVAFNDVDFCMRLRQTGKAIVWSAHAVLTHAESASRGKDDSPEKIARASREQAAFRRTWQAGRHTDPFYHPALTLAWSIGPYGALAW